MSIWAYLLRVNEPRWKAALSDKTGASARSLVDALSTLIDANSRIGQDDDGNAVFDLMQDWHILHGIFSGSFEATDDLTSFIVAPESDLPMVGFSAPILHEPDCVPRISAACANVTHAQRQEKYNKITPIVFGAAGGQSIIPFDPDWRTIAEKKSCYFLNAAPIRDKASLSTSSNKII